ncbi:MAG: hypothetical protein QXR06_05015 [Candidatus Bathyarchaeia archaeon]
MALKPAASQRIKAMLICLCFMMAAELRMHSRRSTYGEPSKGLLPSDIYEGSKRYLLAEYDSVYGKS